jgi:hypothetical protein
MKTCNRFARPIPPACDHCAPYLSDRVVGWAVVIVALIIGLLIAWAPDDMTPDDCYPKHTSERCTVQ